MQQNEDTYPRLEDWLDGDTSETQSSVATAAAAAAAVAAEPSAGQVVTAAAEEVAVAALAAVPALTLPVLDSDELHGAPASSQQEGHRELEVNPWLGVITRRNSTVVPPEVRTVKNAEQTRTDSSSAGRSRSGSNSSRDSGINQPVGVVVRRELREEESSGDSIQVTATAVVDAAHPASAGAAAAAAGVQAPSAAAGNDIQMTAVEGRKPDRSRSSRGSSRAPAVSGSVSTERKQNEGITTAEAPATSTAKTATSTDASAASRVAAVPIVIPYQGATGYSHSAAVAMPTDAYINKFCYIPNTVNVLTGGVAVNPAVDVMNRGCKQLSASYLPPLEVPLSQLQQYPCALSFTLAPLLPVRR
jgi:hypothetical protein